MHREIRFTHRMLFDQVLINFDSNLPSFPEISNPLQLSGFLDAVHATMVIDAHCSLLEADSQCTRLSF
jgi:hypothetical protein